MPEDRTAIETMSLVQQATDAVCSRELARRAQGVVMSRSGSGDVVTRGVAGRGEPGRTITRRGSSW